VVLGASGSYVSLRESGELEAGRTEVARVSEGASDESQAAYRTPTVSVVIEFSGHGVRLVGGAFFWSISSDQRGALEAAFGFGTDKDKISHVRVSTIWFEGATLIPCLVVDEYESQSWCDASEAYKPRATRLPICQKTTADLLGDVALGPLDLWVEWDEPRP